MSGQRARPYRFHEATISLCSTCGERITAKIVEQEDAIYLRKRCPTHGTHTELLEEDAAFYLARQKFDGPGGLVRTQTATRNGCPNDCGLCPEHEQRTCIGLIEVTSHCDQRCPVCYANSGSRGHLDLETVGRILDAFQQDGADGGEILQVSGGEPTSHPDILQVLDIARARGVRFLMLNSNGARMADDVAFVKELSRFPPGFEVYLQFDGFEEQTNRRLRGGPLAEVKRRAVDNLTQYGVPITLVATVCKGVNDHEVAHIVQYAIENPNIRGVNFQPLALFGRVPEQERIDRMTLTGILRCLERQSHGMIRKDDFIPLPCDVDRAAAAFFLRKDGEITPVTRQAKVETYLPLLGNTFLFDAGELVRQSAAGACCGTACECLSFLRDFKALLPIGRNLRLTGGKPRYAIENTFRITVTSFIDRYNFDLRSQQKECVHVLTPDLRRIPFSAYNRQYRDSETGGGR